MRTGKTGRCFSDFGIVHTINEEFERKANRRRDDERRTGADDAQRRKANAENTGQQSKKYAAPDADKPLRALLRVFADAVNAQSENQA